MEEKRYLVGPGSRLEGKHTWGCKPGGEARLVRLG